MLNSVSSQFIGQSLHFGVNLFAALACIAGGWLYLDAGAQRRHVSELAKGIGFIVLALAFMVSGGATSSPVFEFLATLLKLIGYGSLAYGTLASPLQPRPNTANDGYRPVAPTAAGPTTTAAAGTIPAPLLIPVSWLVPAAALSVALLHWRTATRGLERHLKPLAYAFSILALSEILGLSSLYRTSNNPLLQPLANPLGWFWWLQHATLIVGTVVLGRWIWHYLTKRLLTQLFLVITSVTFSIVLIATTSVSALLLASLQHDALTSLETSTKVLRYAVDSQTSDTRADAQILAANSSVAAAVSDRDRADLAGVAADTLAAQRLADVILTDDAGVVLARGSDPARAGDSLSNDPLVQRALAGQTTSSFTAGSSAPSPTLLLTTATPVKQQGQVIGTALASLTLDNAFVDGLKHNTGLDSTVYSGLIRAATTLTGPDGTSRSVGLKETSGAIRGTVITRGQTWSGVADVSGTPYLAVYLPLKTSNNSVVGMLSVGQPEDVVLKSAESAIGITFAGATAALLLLMLPVYLLARQITKQLH
ncbi:MAG TPA: cache domain-containing protein [Candidatus Saccharimonadia bacterium]|jgi:hypothetical protein|nr:cache domain-containing protein [Candidatus Saccharimonadia bacterium]